MKKKKSLSVPVRKASPSRVAGAPSRRAATASRPSTRSRKKAIQDASVSLYEKALDAVDQMAGTLLYTDKQKRVRMEIHNAFDKLYRTIHKSFRGISALGARKKVVSSKR